MCILAFTYNTQQTQPQPPPTWMSLPVVHTMYISAKYTQFGGIQWKMKALYFFDHDQSL